MLEEPNRLESCSGGSKLPPLYYLGGDPSAGSPTDTLLRLNPPCRIAIREGQKAHPHQDSTRMVWRAVCARSRGIFTAGCWPAITTESNFMRAGCSPQSELRLGLGIALTFRCRNLLSQSL